MLYEKFYTPLELPPRPDMQHPGYLEAVRKAGDVLRAAEPWLLVPMPGGERYVAQRRTLGMMAVTWVVNLARRPARWWRGRLLMAYFARQSKGNRNG